MTHVVRLHARRAIFRRLYLVTFMDYLAQKMALTPKMVIAIMRTQSL
jgi:hypothetical protein